MRNRITEAPFVYDGDERMDSAIEKKISDPNDPLVRALGGVDIAEKLASSRFRKVANKLREVTGLGEKLTNSYVFSEIFMDAAINLGDVISIESKHRENLKKLALMAAIEITGIRPEWYNFSLKLNERSEIPFYLFKQKAKEIKIELNSEDDLDRLDKLKFERDKRIIINSITAGNSSKGHYGFEMPQIKKIIDLISPSLYTNYQKIMSINEILYFKFDELLTLAAESGNLIGGKSRITVYENKATIHAEGLIFPILLHEIIKGIEEAKSLHGLPRNIEDAELVSDETDTITNEPMALRIGPEIVERIRFSLPSEVFEPENNLLISYFQSEFYSLPAEEFLTVIKNIISDNEKDNKKGITAINELMKKAKMNHQQYQMAMKGEDLNQ